ncbi:MAG: rhamnogalacturonan lyase [Prevotella sp.]|nr:rhamnogalacturonan lyase [Prevotella sp.]
MEKIQRERLDRGVVALRQTDGTAVVTWRTLTSDGKGEPFDILRNGVKLNDRPLTTGGTFFVDKDVPEGDVTYEIRGGGKNGTYTLKAGAPAGYLPIKLDKPEGGITPDGRTFTYSANDASVGDVDGDGQYEIILKWEPSNAHDNSHDGFTGPVLFDCYRLSGERLWRIDMGPNIRAGAHYTQFMVYDFDGDGRAEMMVKTADGTVDGLGKVIGDPKADWRYGIGEAMEHFEENRAYAVKEAEERARRMAQPRRPQAGQQNDRQRGGNDRNGNRQGDRQRYTWPGIIPYAGRILDGPEYLTVFNGLTGEAMATVDYIPERGELRAWGDNRGNRSERYLAGVGYLDGHRASGIFCRGYYTRTVIAAWDWDGKQLTNRWTFDTNDKRWRSYAGQGNHNIRIADVDGDGCDEITYGSMAVDHDGTGLYNTGMGHGDAMHLTVFDPTSDRLQLWDCHENRRDGSDLRDAATGEILFQIKSPIDVGRCMAADIDPTNPGLEMWSSDSKGIRTIKGDVLKPVMQRDATERKKADAISTAAGQNAFTPENNDDTALYIRGMRLPTNFGIWWDGDLLREMLDRATVSKYDWNTGNVHPIVKFDGCQFNNGTKSNPCLSADILGDWREEVITRTDDSSEMRIYVSPIPTDHRINCLMEDITYRLSVATENVAYNQPPWTGFYLGPDKTAVEFLK